MDKQPLPRVVTDTDAGYLDPSLQLQGCPVGARVGASNYGTELLSYDVVREAFLDGRMTPRTIDYYKARGATPTILEFVREGNLPFMEPEKHDRIRGIVGKAFTRARVDAFRETMRQIAEEQMAAVVDKGRCDLVADFCHFYPIRVFAKFLGVPAEDVPRLAEATVQTRLLGQSPFEPGIPTLEAALRFQKEYMQNLIAERRANPRDDFADALIALQNQGEKLSEDELVWALVFLFLGGHDTTRFTLAGCLHSLITCGLWEQVAANPEMIPDFIAESMRYRPGTPRQIRVVAEPWELDGHEFKVGDVVSLNLSAAGRDATRFENPGEFHCGRDPAYLLGFGQGRHVCLGQLLAKTEMAEAIAIVTSTLADVALAGPCVIKPTGVIAGFDSVPVTFKPRKRA
jgi:cytochrome P450